MDEPPIWATEFAPDEADHIDPPAPQGDWDHLYRYTGTYYVARWEKRNGKDRKQFSPLCWDGQEWQRKCLIEPGRRPLYRLDDIPDSGPVLLVEGEKKADAARKYIPPHWFVTCWSGGGQAPGQTDLTPLRGRHVVYWRDNDEGGVESVRKLREVFPHFAVIDPPLNFPPKWDLADPLPEGYSAAWVTSAILGARAQAKPEEAPQPGAAQDTGTFDPINWEGTEVPVRRWLVPGLIPWHVPVMLSGMGGLGKTLLGLQLAHAVTTGQKWIGRDVTPVKVLGLFCEDDADELQRRIHDINVNTGTGFGDLENLRLMIRDGAPSSLMDFDGQYGPGTESEFFAEVIRQAKDFGAQLIILDSLYNFFAGNENSRPQVHQFVYALKRMAKECDAALVFLAHPSKSGISTGEGYAGSTAWHDAVRSRLYLTEEGGTEGEEKRLVLKTMKANYAPKDGQIEVYYQGGMLWPRHPETTDAEPVTLRLQADIIFMKCLAVARAGGRNPTDSKNASNYAPKMFKTMGEAAGIKQGDLVAAMGRLFDEKRIEVRTEMDRHRHKLRGIYAVQHTQTEDIDPAQGCP